MTAPRDRFHNMLRVLLNIGAHELGNPEWWPEYQRDPFRFFIRCDDERATLIWSAMAQRRYGGAMMIVPAADMESLRRTGMMLDRYADNCFPPPNENGQVHFSKILMDSAAQQIVSLFYPLRELCTHVIAEHAGCCRKCGIDVEELE